MTEAIGQALTHKTQEALKPREKLSDEEMGNLLSAVGNHEAKAITLILMRDGITYDAGKLHRAVLDAQGENKGWRMKDTGPFGYCFQSLAPIGLVAKETLNSDLSTYGYQITPKGKELGITLAGLLLGFSEKYNISLNLLFGSTTSTSKERTIKTEKEDFQFKKRAPSTTLKILFELLTSPSLPIRETDLAKRMGEHAINNLTKNLIRLSTLGLIEYTTKEVNRPFSWYKLSSSIYRHELPIDTTRPTLTKLVLNVLKKYPDRDFTIEDVYNFLPRKQKKGHKKNLVQHISSILSLFNKNGIADIKKFNNEKHSEINITEEQRVVLNELIEIIDKIQDQDPEMLKEGGRFAEKIISNTDRVSKLLKRAKETSSAANKAPTEERQKDILSIVLSNPGITNKEIQRLLEKDDRRLGIGSISRLSHSLSIQKSVIVKKEGNVNKFFPRN